LESEAVERCAELRKHRFCNRSTDLAPWECFSVFPVGYGFVAERIPLRHNPGTRSDN